MLGKNNNERKIMSTNHYTIGGEHHILLRIKGDPARIKLFHALMHKCDSDWPWAPHRTTCRVCVHCVGAVWNCPRIAAPDIIVAAKQVGGIKVKIRHFAPVTKCRGKNMSFDYLNDLKNTPADELHELYRAHGVVSWMEKHIIPPSGIVIPPLVTKPPILTATEVRTVEAPHPTDECLMEEVLSTEGDLLPDTTPSNLPAVRMGSLIQFPEGYDMSDFTGMIQ